MSRHCLPFAVVALSTIASVAGQDLGAFIGAAGSAVSVVNSAKAKETSSTSSSSSTSSPSPTTTPPPAATAASTPSAAPSPHGLSSGAKIGIIVGAIVAALLLLALLGLLCCCLIRSRRRRRRSVTPVAEREVESWKSPINPGRHYSNYTPAQKGHVPMEQSTTIPLMAAAATEHHRATHSQAPSLSQHPAMRQGPQNPFVPAPPSPRRVAPNSRPGLTDGMVVGADPYVTPEKRSLRDRSRSRSNSRPQSGILPTHTDADRPPTPFGLSGFGTPAGQDIQKTKGASPKYSGIGQPYEDMHVHVLQTDAPSRELRQSLKARETAGVPTAAYDSDEHTKFRNSRGYSTPPEVPSRSPKRASTFADSSYESSLSNGTTSHSSEGYHRNSDPYAPAQRDSMAPWEQHQRRFSNSPHTTTQVVAPPPIPWNEPEQNNNRQRRHSHSPRQSLQNDGRRRSSRSPATSINGQPRRLRFEDLHANGNGNGYSAIPGQHDSYDGYNDYRWSQGVGEAL